MSGGENFSDGFRRLEMALRCLCTQILPPATGAALISLHNINIFPRDFPFSWYILMICLLMNDHNFVLVHLSMAGR